MNKVYQKIDWKNAEIVPEEKVPKFSCCFDEEIEIYSDITLDVERGDIVG